CRFALPRRSVEAPLPDRPVAPVAPGFYSVVRAKKSIIMAIRTILHYPDPRLREPAKPVEEVTDEIRKLAQDMAETMYAAPGVGLAAPQIGVAKRVFVIDIAGEDEPSDLRTFINPEIVRTEGKQIWCEGCLSFPGVSEDVERA